MQDRLRKVSFERDDCRVKVYKDGQTACRTFEGSYNEYVRALRGGGESFGNAARFHHVFPATPPYPEIIAILTKYSPTSLQNLGSHHGFRRIYDT